MSFRILTSGVVYWSTWSFPPKHTRRNVFVLCRRDGGAESCFAIWEVWKGWGVSAGFIVTAISVALRNVWIGGFSEKQTWRCCQCAGTNAVRGWTGYRGECGITCLTWALSVNIRQPGHRMKQIIYYSEESPFLPLECCCSCHCDPFTFLTFVKCSTSQPKNF